MNINEIITNPPRDEYIDDHQQKFRDINSVATIRGLSLKKIMSDDEIEYGLVDDKDQLVGYLALEDAGNSMWVATLAQLAQAYKGLGYGTFLYDYAVMNDKLKLLSDATNTSGKNGSVELWNRLRNNKRYDIVGYDVDTNQIIPDATFDMIYNEKPNTRWLALPSSKTINESLTYIQSNMKRRFVVWYGPGTSTPEYFNY